MKECNKTPGEKIPNEKEINNLPDKMFKAIVIRTSPELRKKIDEHNENLKKKKKRTRKIELIRVEAYNN